MRRITRSSLVFMLISVACAGTAAETSPPTSAIELPSTAPTAQTPPVSAEPSTSTTIDPPPATPPPATPVAAPGTYQNAALEIRIAFHSEVHDVTSDELRTHSLSILNAADGWGRSGFTFVADASSELRVVLAEPSRVDELCLPLTTHGVASCQNAAVVALNADRWRDAADDWDASLAAYQTYLVNHEVGHLIGLRHPIERCPTDDRISAAMEPQTGNLQGCVGNGIPLEWEIEWAARRPVVIGPPPDWQGPQPVWPTGAGI